MTGNVWLLQKSIYGSRKAGWIWGSLLVETILKCGFKKYTKDKHVLFLYVESNYIFLCIIADDIAFESNFAYLINFFKDKMSYAFDIKLFGELKSLIGCEVGKIKMELSVGEKSNTSESF